MKSFLLFKDREFDPDRAPPWNESALAQDLALNTLFGAMAAGDKFVFNVARAVVLAGLDNDLETISYRQAILSDCLRNPDVVKAIYDVAVAAIEGEKGSYWSFFGNKYPAGVLRKGMEGLRTFTVVLKKLRSIADEHQDKFQAEGFRNLFSMVQQELDPAYFAKIDDFLKELNFRGGVLVSAGLGKGLKGADYVLRRTPFRRRGWLEQLFTPKPAGYTFRLHPRDESGARALSILKDKGINLAANALAQSSDHILGFFTTLRTELAFYLGCLNLYERLSRKGEPACFPAATAAGMGTLAFRGLYDVCLSLSMERRVVGNDAQADGKDLLIITGANQGGKSTFLRSIGLAQLMMQAGMFVAAAQFGSALCDSLVTHYKREEDVTMTSGKFDEELSRMSAAVNHLTPLSMVLFNESFAATNEREGSEIAGNIVAALHEAGIRIFFVTHLYEFARRLYERKLRGAMFLRAERRPDGARSFRLIEKEPLQTSHGKDLYESVFNGRERLPTEHVV